ncbi:MAG: alpha/beta fold hydrolase [Bacteroidetes bacterium]|nr:alpha/beta fold hydrolase [Bacteroidota bacterium]
MDLYFREFGDGKPLIILHGLLGSSDNWLTIGRKLSHSRKVFIIDQRNHGKSFHSDIFDYSALSQDIDHFIHSRQLVKPVLMGHSMGGKTAMNYAITHPEALDRLIVVDISPKQYDNQHVHILDGLSSIDLTNLTLRNEADAQLEKFVPEAGIRQFLLKNLTRDDQGQFKWRLNLKTVREKIDNVGQALPEGAFSAVKALFIYGGNSDYIQSRDLITIPEIFPQAQFAKIEDAGHWVHSEKMEEFLEVVENFLEE